MERRLRAHRYTTWQLVKLYWQSERPLYIYLTTFVIIVMTLGLVACDLAISYWFNYFYDALQAYNKQAVIRLLFAFFAIAAIFIILAVYRYYISQMFAWRWRKWLTEQFINRWLAKRDYYYLEVFDKHVDNPDQRIQEDIAALTTSTINLTLGFITATATFFAFIYVLWELSGSLHLDLGPLGSWRVEGYLVWVAIVYSVIGTYLTFKIGYPLIGLNFEQQRREANFRFAAIDVRSHAENVALYRGEKHQKGILNNIFGGVLANWYQIILRQKKILWFTAGFNQAAVALPLLVVLPNYFERVFLLGGFMQSIRAFGSIQDSLSFFVNSYTQIAEWRAVTQRLTTFLDHLQETDERVMQNKKLKVVKKAENKIEAKSLSISKPDGDGLLSNINEELKHGHSYLIKGPSGIGKSTFIRAIAGIWPYAQGEVLLPQDKKIMYLPQKSYMPIGTLSEAILFPDKQYPELKKEVERVLHECHLDQFIPRLNETATWSQQLSPGEQQRIAFARVLLHKPDWVFLDESTSMLDLQNEAYLYELLKTKLPNTSLVSVGHRPSLDNFHEHVIDMNKYRESRTLSS